MSGGRRTLRTLLLGTWLVTLALLAACSGEGPLPRAGDLLRGAADQLRDLRTVRFSLALEGPVGPYSIRSAEGVLTRDGRAQGTVSLEQGGSLIEYDVVLAEGGLYLKGPTGGFQRVPDLLSAQVYDPASLLDPETGVANILATASRARTVGAESVGGIDAYRVDATISATPLADVMPLGAILTGVSASLWIGADRPVLLQVRIASPAAGGDEATTLTLTLDRVNEPANITPPE